MDQYNDLVIGQVVRSLKGRDKGKIQIVLRLLEDSCVLVVDGKRRKIENPKKKKIKHLQRTSTILVLNDDINDCKIRKMLKAFENE